jgi:predicted nucleic acid-binding protein
MLVVDTSAFIEWLIGSKTGEGLTTLLPVEAEWLVPTLVQFELAKWLTRERGEDMADEVIAFTQTCVVVPLDTAIALRAVESAGKHMLATADAIVYATALEHSAELLTCDAHFEGLMQVIYRSKTA